MPSHYESAYYACQSYSPDGGKVLPGWEIADKQYPQQHRWNFGMTSYLHAERRELVIAFRGTENFWDLLADFGLWQEQAHPNQDLGIRHAASVINKHLSRQVQESIGALSGSIAATYLDSAPSRSILLSVLAVIMFEIIAAGVGASLIPTFSTLAPALTAMGIMGGGVGLEALRTKLFNQTAERIGHVSPDLRQHLSDAITQGNLLSVTFVGHSMGGYLAELIACYFYAARQQYLNCEIKALTLDSPGCASIVRGLPEYVCPKYDFITTYLSAPNLVNTCHQHLGNIRRLYIPYVADGHSWSWSHAATSMGASAARAATYAAAAAGAVAGGALVYGAITGAASATGVAASAAGVAGVATPVAAVTAAVTTAFKLVFKDKPWFDRQHAKANQLDCFDKKPEPPAYSIMKSWPYVDSLISMAANQIGGLLHHLKPLSNDTAGVRTIFDENWMYENQVKTLSEYEIANNVGQLPDWAQ